MPREFDFSRFKWHVFADRIVYAYYRDLEDAFRIAKRCHEEGWTKVHITTRLDRGKLT